MSKFDSSEPIVEEGEGMLKKTDTEEELEAALEGKVKFFTLTLTYDPTDGSLAGASAYHGDLLKAAGATAAKAMECQAIASTVTKATQHTINHVGEIMELVSALQAALAGEEKPNDSKS